MKNHIITVENIYKNEYLIPAEDVEGTIKRITNMTFGNMCDNSYADMSMVRLYIRKDSEPKGTERLFGTITMDEGEESDSPMCAERDDRCCGEMCAECNRDCDHCPFDEFRGEEEDDLDDFDGENDESPDEEIAAYLGLISNRLEILTSLLEKVYKVSPEK